MYRNTFVEVNLSAVKHNVQSLIQKYSDYKYYFGVVKADCYGHGAIETTRAILDAGCNYLCVATLDEALELRAVYHETPILCLGIINPAFSDVCAENNITITVSNLAQLQAIPTDLMLKMHIKLNTGMNRLGVSSKSEFNQIYDYIKSQPFFTLEGIYTHIYDAENRERTEKQYETFEQITSDINLDKIPIVHVGASEATEYYTKRPYANGCRLGISMYGLIDYKDIEFESTYSLVSEVIQINEIQSGETVGYGGNHQASANEHIAVIPIGYADGFIRKNTGRNVYINGEVFPIVGNICMDMAFIKVDNSVQVGDKVYLLKDIKHIQETAKHLDTITYEVICSPSKRVPRIYK